MEGKEELMQQNQLFMQLYYEASKREQPLLAYMFELRAPESPLRPAANTDGTRPFTVSQFRTAEQLTALSEQFQSRLDAIVPPKPERERRALVLLVI